MRLEINGIEVDLESPPPMTFEAGQVIQVVVSSDFAGHVVTKSGVEIPVEHGYSEIKTASARLPVAPSLKSGFVMPNEDCTYIAENRP